MVLRNWLRRYALSDPGQVYALMILAGQRTWPFDAAVGAGPAVLASDGVMWWGKALVSSGESLEVPLDVPPTASRVDAALWWPDYAVGLAQRNDLDLALVAPSGLAAAESHDPHSVFERARVQGSGALESGTWKLAIRGLRVVEATQVVYWAAAAGPGCQ
jgi:hypothetical protein